MIKERIKIFITLLMSILILSCSQTSANNQSKIEEVKTDYSDKNNWIVIPENPNDREVLLQML